MNRLNALCCSVLLSGVTSLAFAQEATPVASPAVPAEKAKWGNHPRIMEVHKRIGRQRGRIEAALKAGTLTPAEAKALGEKLGSIRDEMQADIKANGKRELTEEQFKQLNEELNANSAAIKDGQGEGGPSNPGTPNP